MSAGTLSSIRSGARRPSPGLAKRIEAATSGQVSAASLLGLEEAGSPFDRDGTATALGDGRWSVVVAPDNSVMLSADMVRGLGFHANDRLLFKPHGDQVLLTSAARSIRKAQAEFNRLVPPEIDVVGDFLRDRRAEAERE